jgi:hypothetical protein
LLFLPAAYAVCPVCTVAIGAGLEGARLLGIDDIITGIWAGGLTLSMFFWTAGWLKNKRGVRSFFWYGIVNFLVYFGLLGCIYLLPGINFAENTLFGIDKFMFGIIVGVISFYFGARWYINIKRKNGGHSKYPFQKVIVPIAFLLFSTALFAAILYI